MPDVGDYDVSRAHVGQTARSAAGSEIAVPEPATIVMFALAMVMLFFSPTH
jgi:hypothetical protein